MNTETTPSQSPTDHEHQRRKRSKEELEALAQTFIGAPVAEDAPKRALPKRTLLIGGGIAAAAVLVVAVLAFWPEAEEVPAARQASADRAAQQAEELRRKFEAERERTRKNLEAGKAYMDRIAQADSELAKDMQSRAGALAARAAAPAPSPAGSSGVPTPKDERKAAVPAPAPAKPAAATPSPAPAASTQEPAKAAPQSAPQQQVASAAPATAEAKASCKIHVSELSGSGKLTYEDVKRMKGARYVEKTGHVFTPPVKNGSQTVVFEVLPTGCVNVVRSLHGG